ncbi:protein SRC2 homolog [Neltuma alba]|uniref:protein SRC2 homolog n=1 Tax=Neltuma alba TaxID=207710 RepID=UPI0010A2FA2A|nr:protein SRC2 homolog [Prosopis alba]
MELCSIELKIISCKDLKNFNFFQKLTIYTLVYIHSIHPERKLDEKQAQEQKTHTDREGNENPEWNEVMKFYLGWVSLHDCDDLFLHFEFRHDGLIIGDKLIGEVRVPLKDLILEAGNAPGVVRFLNYEIRNGEGKPNGIFNFSCRLIDKKGAENRISSENVEGKITGYPLLDPALTDHYPPNESRMQTSTLEIQSISSGDRISYPIVTLPADPIDGGHNSPSAPPLVSSASAADYHYHYSPISPQYPPPSAGLFMPPPPPQLPPPFPMHYPYPPPPPPPPPHMEAYGPHFYEPVRPEAHGWASHPNFQHSWGPRW